MAWADTESEVRSEKTQVPFLRSPMGKGVMPEDRPLSVAAARTLALQNADVVFLMGARFNWIFHPGFRRDRPRSAAALCAGRQGHPARYRARRDRSQQSLPRRKPGATDVALVGPRVGPYARLGTGSGKAIMAQMNAALAGRQWFHPKESPRRQMISKKAAENAEQIRPQVNDDSAPATYYRAFKDIAARMPKNSILSAEGAGTMDIGLTMLPVFSAKACLNAGTYGTMGLGLGQAIAAAVVHPDRPVIHLSGDSAIGFSGMEMETLARYNLPVKIVVLNNGGIGPGMPEIPENPMFNMKPNSLIYGARYDRVMEAPGFRRGRLWRQGRPEAHPRRPR
jgi:2-hydroxyacyl-CoA lyase